jgi:DNA-binding transcriptional regulator LsrR (DeoR family)
VAQHSSPGSSAAGKAPAAPPACSLLKPADVLAVAAGQNVLQVVDNVPANVDSTPAVGMAYRRAAQALAAKILGHM